MWGGVCVSCLFPGDGPVFRDEVLSDPDFQVKVIMLYVECFLLRYGMRLSSKSLRVSGETWLFGS